MKWVDSRNSQRPTHAQPIIDFCGQHVLPHVIADCLIGFTEYKGKFNSSRADLLPPHSVRKPLCDVPALNEQGMCKVDARPCATWLEVVLKMRNPPK